MIVAVHTKHQPISFLKPILLLISEVKYWWNNIIRHIIVPYRKAQIYILADIQKVKLADNIQGVFEK